MRGGGKVIPGSSYLRRAMAIVICRGVVVGRIVTLGPDHLHPHAAGSARRGSALVQK
jgi:hypothetical protein